MKIRYKLILGFLVIALLISFVGYLTVKRSQDALQKSIEESSVILASKVMDEIDRNIFRRVEEAQSYCRDLLLQEAVIRSNQEYERLRNAQEYIDRKSREWLSVPKERITPFMRGLLDSKVSEELHEKINFYKEKYGYKVFNNIIVTNRYGAIVSITGKTPDFSQNEKGWWKEAKENRFYIRDAEYEEWLNAYSISFAVRIDDDEGNFIGVMKCLLNIEDVIQAIKQFETPDTNQVKKTIYKLVNKRGKLVYSTDDFTFLENVIDFSRKHAEPERQKSHIFLRHDHKYGELLSVCVHSNFNALGLMFLVEHATKKLFAPIDKLKRDLSFISLAITALAIFLGIFLSASISNPVTKLRDAAVRIGRGDLDTDIEIHPADEIGDLAFSFKKMTEDLKKTTVSKAYLDNIITTMVDSLVVVDMEGKIRTINEATKKLLGYEEEELINQPLRLVFPEANDEKSVSELLLKGASDNSMSREGFIVNEEKIYLSKDGRRIPVLFSASVMHDRKGMAEGLVCIALDITERKIAEEKVLQYAEEVMDANEELKSFAYIISHDLRSPLVNIRGFAGELRYSLQEIGSAFDHCASHIEVDKQQKLAVVLQKEVPEALEFIDSSVYRMDNLIKSILNLSRLGRRDLKPEAINMESLVQSILKSLAHQIEQKNVTVTVGALPDIFADKIAMEQIFGNILDNALKYLEPGRAGSIEISAEQGQEETVFHIRDNGRGIAENDIRKIFEVFQRVGSQNVPGEGMGLAYVKALIRRHGGRIWCESELKVGTTFSFLLPRTSKQFDQERA